MSWTLPPDHPVTLVRGPVVPLVVYALALGLEARGARLALTRGAVAVDPPEAATDADRDVLTAHGPAVRALVGYLAVDQPEPPRRVR